MTELKARPTVYKGIQMRSRLEAGFAAWLDQRGFEWQYEPTAFATERGQYLPDFRIEHLTVISIGDVHRACIEIKPAGWLERCTRDQLVALVGGMDLVWASEPTAAFLIVQQGAPVRLFARPATEDDVKVPAFCEWIDMGDSPPALGMVATRPWDGEYWKVR